MNNKIKSFSLVRSIQTVNEFSLLCDNALGSLNAFCKTEEVRCFSWVMFVLEFARRKFSSAISELSPSAVRFKLHIASFATKKILMTN